MNTVQIISGSKRIDYVDHLKGFAILLVVMSHVIGKTLGYDHIFLLNVITSFYMPLFMFLSGLCCRKKNNLLYNIIKKWKGFWCLLYYLGFYDTFLSMKTGFIYSILNLKSVIGSYLFCLSYLLYTISYKVYLFFLK